MEAARTLQSTTRRRPPPPSPLEKMHERVSVVEATRLAPRLELQCTTDVQGEGKSPRREVVRSSAGAGIVYPPRVVYPKA